MSVAIRASPATTSAVSRSTTCAASIRLARCRPRCRERGSSCRGSASANGAGAVSTRPRLRGKCWTVLRTLGHVIRGALSFDELAFCPRQHPPREDFYIGKLARPDLDKWSSNHWRILERVPYAGRRALAMGWTLSLVRKCGTPPAWAETFTPQQRTIGDFLGRCHALVGLNGGARENWPRVGLEAMAAGVPLVCQNLWGWREMIVDGETGFLTDSDDEMAFRLAQLAHDEPLRQRMARAARAHVEQLSDPVRLGRQWKELFESLECVGLPTLSTTAASL